MTPMPRIPSVDELPLVRPRPLSSIAVDTGAGHVARALDGLGEAFEGFGEKLSQQSKKAQDADQLAKLNQRSAEAGGEIADLARSLAGDPDYETYPDRFKAKVEEIRARHRPGLAPDMAERFDARFRDHALAHALEVRALGTRRLVASAEAALDRQLESLAGFAVAAGNDAGHRSLTAQALKALDDHVEAGFISRDDRDLRARRFLADVGERQVLAMARLDPEETARRLKNPNGFPELDDDRRTQLAGYARSLGRSLARDREMADARAEANALTQRFEAARAFESDWRDRLADGGATLAELDDAVLRGVLAAGDAATLRREAEHAVEQRKHESDFVERVHGAIAGGKPLDPADADDRAAVDHVFKTLYRPRLIEAVAAPEAFARLLPDLARDIERIGSVPDGVADLVDAWWASGDPRFQAGAARLVRMVYRPDGTEGEHAGALPLGAMPDGVPERLDLAARLIEAGIPDEIAVSRAAGKDGVVRLSATEGATNAGEDDPGSGHRRGLPQVAMGPVAAVAPAIPAIAEILGITASQAARLLAILGIGSLSGDSPKDDKEQERDKPQPAGEQVIQPVEPPPPELPPIDSSQSITANSQSSRREAASSASSKADGRTRASYPSAKELHDLAADDETYFATIQNRRFLKGPEGTADIGRAGPTSENELGVRLARRDLPHVDTPLKAKHAIEAGYNNGVDLTVDVAANWHEVRSGHPNPETGNERLVLVKRNGANKVAVVELERFAGDDFYRVVTSGVRSDASVEALTLIRKRPAAP
jgi:hypothetical protein